MLYEAQLHCKTCWKAVKLKLENLKAELLYQGNLKGNCIIKENAEHKMAFMKEIWKVELFQ